MLFRSPSATDALVVVVLLICWTASPATAQPQPAAEEVCGLVAGLGLENVAVTAEEGELRIEYENRHFRYEMDAMAAVLEAVAPRAGAGQIVLVPKNTNVPLLTIAVSAAAYRDFAAGRISAREFAQTVRVSAAAGPPERQPRSPSLNRPDYEISPAVEYAIGVLSRGEFHSKARLTIRPSVVLPLGTGLSATARINMDLKGDTFYGDRAMVAWTGRAGPPMFYSLKVGRLQRQDDGILGEVLWCDRRDRTRLHAVAAQVWPRPWDDSQQQFTASVQHDLPGGDRSLTLTGGRFLDGDTGISVAFARRFRQSRVGIEYVRTGRNRLGVFSLTTPLGPRSRLPVGMLRPTPEVPFEYRTPEDPNKVADAGRGVETGNDLLAVRKGLTAPYVVGHVGELVAAPQPPQQRDMAARGLSSVCMEGTSGAVRTPVADVLDEGAASVGLGLRRRSEAKAPGSPLIGERALPMHVLVGLLPRTEAGVRIAFFRDGSIDRSLNVQYLLKRQSADGPAVALGWQGFGQNSAHRGFLTGQPYAVATWRRGRGQASLGLGYNPSRTDSRLDGPFGSAQWEMSPDAHATVEYDGEGANAGVTVQPAPGLSVTGALLDGRRLGGNVSFGWQLQ
jgi:hypothetical protein